MAASVGTVTPKTPVPSRADVMGPPIVFQDPPLPERHITWHLKDSDERAAAYIAGPAPCRLERFYLRCLLVFFVLLVLIWA